MAVYDEERRAKLKLMTDETFDHWILSHIVSGIRQTAGHRRPDATYRKQSLADGSQWDNGRARGPKSVAGNKSRSARQHQ